MFQVASLIAVHILILAQLRFEVWPEMLLMPYLMNHGFELYRDMIAPWTPGLMWILQGWFWLTELSVPSLKILTWLIIIFTDTLIYFIAVKRWGKIAGMFALLSFLLLQPIFDGNGLWFDLAVVPLLLLAFYFNNPLFLAPAFLIKQSVVWLFPLFWRQWKRLALGIIGSIGLSMVWFWLKGDFGEYLFWAYDFTFRLFPRMPGHLDLGAWKHWVLALAPFFLIGGMTRLRQNATSRQGEDPFWWAVLLIPFALPRFGLFHFQPAVAFIALALGESVVGLRRGKPAMVFLALAGVIYLAFVWQRMITFQWHKSDRFLEPVAYQTAAKMVFETDKNQQVLLVNGPELAYVLSDRLPPKPWLTQFPWFLELPGFQETLIDRFKQQDLGQIFLFPYQNEGEFIPGSYRPGKLLEYINSISQ